MLRLSTLLVLVLLPVLAVARVEQLDISLDDRRLMHLERFGYEPKGELKLHLKRFQVHIPIDNTKRREQVEWNMAFVLVRSASEGIIREEDLGGRCFHELVGTPEASKPGPVADVTQGAVVMPVKRAYWKEHSFEETVSVGGYYHLYFSNCEKQTRVDFGAKITMYNVASNGNRVYLSAGESSLPAWYFVLCLLFVAELTVWTRHLVKHEEFVKNIHHLMTLVLLLKVGTLFFESFDLHYIKTTGSPHGWNVIFYIFSFCKGMLFVIVIVLIGTGWSYMKPFMTDRDKQIMVAVLTVQAMVNLSMIIVDETAQGTREWLTWRDLLYLLDMICCCVVLLPIVWSIKHLREVGESDGKTARTMERLQRFRKFYLLVILYIYFTRIVVFLLESVLPFELLWLGAVFSELAALTFYATTGYLFRPAPQNPYLAISGDDRDDDVES